MKATQMPQFRRLEHTTIKMKFPTNGSQIDFANNVAEDTT